jgi:hypothetical protein
MQAVAASLGPLGPPPCCSCFGWQAAYVQPSVELARVFFQKDQDLWITDVLQTLWRAGCLCAAANRPTADDGVLPCEPEPLGLRTPQLTVLLKGVDHSSRCF